MRVILRTESWRGRKLLDELLTHGVSNASADFLAQEQCLGRAVLQHMARSFREQLLFAPGLCKFAYADPLGGHDEFGDRRTFLRAL